MKLDNPVTVMTRSDLWKNEDYDSAGDYTQNQLENRLLEVLGENLQDGPQNLFSIEIL